MAIPKSSSCVWSENYIFSKYLSPSPFNGTSSSIQRWSVQLPSYSFWPSSEAWLQPCLSPTFVAVQPPATAVVPMSTLLKKKLPTLSTILKVSPQNTNLNRLQRLFFLLTSTFSRPRGRSILRGWYCRWNPRRFAWPEWNHRWQVPMAQQHRSLCNWRGFR